MGPVSSVERADNVERKAEQLKNILGVLGGNSSNGASANASGRWVGNYTNTKGDAGKSTITINQLADGTITGDEDGWRIENGRRNGNSLTWRYLRQNSGCRNYDVALQLSNDGETFTGTYQVTDSCARSTYSGRYVSYKRQ